MYLVYSITFIVMTEFIKISGDFVYLTIKNSIRFLVILLFGLLFTNPGMVHAQDYDLLLKGGHVIDPKNDIDGLMDVAITDGRVTAVEANIDVNQSKQTIDVAGFYVTPGFIDIHAHVFTGSNSQMVTGGGLKSMYSDGFTLRAGVTTAVDAGSSGWRNFSTFRENIIDSDQIETRILAFLNITGYGHRRGHDLDDMNPRITAEVIRMNPDKIVGIKACHWRSPTWENVDLALEAGRLADVPIMVDFGTFFPEDRPFEELVGERLRPGDIYTHLYLPSVPMLDQENRLRPYLLDAQRRGVIFDAGHGQGSFAYWQAVPATRDGFWPNTISTDIHAGNINRGMKNMANVMSKFLNLGLSLQEVIARSTWAPAQAIQRPELGNLTPGSGADITVFNLRKGNFGFYDIYGGRAAGDRKIEVELTLRDGVVVWDLNGISMDPWQELSPDSPYR